jgi:hypothetical protein
LISKYEGKIKHLEEIRSSEASMRRKEREELIREKEEELSRNVALTRALDLKEQAEVLFVFVLVKSVTTVHSMNSQARFSHERKGWADRVERVEELAAAAKQDAKVAGDEVLRLQVRIGDIFEF